MKNKSSHHKVFNTFKFQSFADRIANIDVDIFHKVGHAYEADADETGCYFYQAIQNWSILNLTESFNAFKKEIKAYTLVTLPQLLLEKESVIQILIKHLKLQNPLCLQPLLDIVVAVAKDLRKDFYPYYKDFVEVLIVLLNTKDVEQLEWTFTCLAYLFKFLWRPLVKDITLVFNTLHPLLSRHKPEYINSFAAESFAFVARKVKDQDAFLLHVLQSVKRKDDGVEGCGKLFFEVIKGIGGQFHSCADSIFTFWLESLSNPIFPQDTLFELLEQIISNIVKNILPSKGELLWISFINLLNHLELNWENEPTEKISHNIELLLKLIGQSIEYNNGKFLQNHAPLVEKLTKTLSIAHLPESCALIGTQVCILILLSKNIKITQEQASSIIRTILVLPHHRILLYFIDNISSFSLFEPLILPTFLQHCAESELCNENLKVLTELILKKAPLSGSGINLDSWVNYHIHFGSKESNTKIENIFITYLDSDNFENYMAALICFPHITLSNRDQVITILRRKVFELIEKIKQNETNLKQTLFVLNNTVECLIHLGEIATLERNFFIISEPLLPLAKNEEYICALKILDILVTALKDSEIIQFSNLIKLNNSLAQIFSSPYHEMRLLVTHLYTFFETLAEFDIKYSQDPEVPEEKFSVFSICHKIESINPQVHTYREQLQNLEKLYFHKPQIKMCMQTPFKNLPLRYFCGCLYTNFKLLWDQILKNIESHAHGLEINDFWEVYGEELRAVVQNIRHRKEFEADDIGPVEWEFVRNLYQSFQQLTTKPDFFNYRLLLWRGLADFADISEAKTRDTSELLLDFIEKEYVKNNSDVAQICNIKQHSDFEPPLETEGPVIDSEEVAKEPKFAQTKYLGRKATTQVLLHCLNVFSKIKSPKSMYREPEINKLYFELLQHKNSDIQKAAFDCILTYKHKYIIPYKEHIYNLIDDKRFKNELTSFQLDKDNSTIQSDHRENLIPIILRIVFSKMSAKTGLRTGGKSQLRRNLVLRFLAGCQEDEMLAYIHMSMRFYTKYLNDDPEIMVNNLQVELDRFIPPKKLQSTLNLIQVILEEFGGLMGENLLTFILQIIFLIGAMVKKAFDMVDSVHSGYLSILKNIRSFSIKILANFFQKFDRYRWTDKQINTVFIVFVFPYLHKLNVEGIHSPTALLKLFIQWGSNPRYFPLLVKYQLESEESRVLPHVIELFLNEKCHISVITGIEGMLQKLLSLQPNEEDLELAIPVDNLLPIAENILSRINLNEKLNYGSCILLPHIPDILKKIKVKLGSKTKSLNQAELFIVSRISELVWEPEISDDTLKLLLPIVHKKIARGIGEDVVLQYLTTVHNLLCNVSNPAIHLRQVTPLFGEVTYASGRKMLIKMLKIVNKWDGSLNFDLGVCLNAWDVKWVDQPDFEKRHDAFKEIHQAIDRNEIIMELGVLIIYCCYFMLKNEADLSLKENASHCLKKLTPYLINKYPKEADYLLNATVLSLIRSGMKSKNYDFRNECIQLLGNLSRDCADTHVVLRDLNRYTNKSDLEVDFFENITHLQLHRHARALLKFSQMTKELTECPNSRTLTQFILPLASFYLCNDKYVSKNSVIDAAIDVIGTVCRVLPWHQFEGLLKFYLNLLRKDIDHQKQLVRIIVVILDSFHFDLTKAQLKSEEKISEVQENKANITETSFSSDSAGENTSKEIPEIQRINKEEENEDSNRIEDADLEIDEILELKPVEQEEEEETDNQELKVFNKTTVLCKSSATRIINTIQNILLPQLHKALAEMTIYESSHKVNRKEIGFEKEEEDLLRVPISLALVKLLQRLPVEILEANLPRIFTKLCSFLKSRLESVRRLARETLQKIMQTLGPTYLNLLLGEMTSLLSRGFHVHVLVFTTHAVISCLKESYQPTDIDKVLLTVLQLCQADLFGSLSEEKEVLKIAVKTSEAKSTKSFDTFQILAQFVTDKCLLDLILPIKNVLQSSKSYEVTHKAQECLRHITLGLVDNNFVQIDSLLKFAYGAASENIEQLLCNDKKKLSTLKDQRKKLLVETSDCFLIPKETVRRSGQRVSNVKSSTKTNSHLLVEFGLRLCLVMLKREKLKNEEFRCFLDPFVVIFRNCLNSKHVKLSSLTLQCLIWVMKYDLPSMRDNISEITKDIFSILHKLASAGLSKGDNFELVMAAFKAMSVIVRDVQYHTIDTDQLKVLLLYAEQDMHNHDRQATAFNLLKAIISRKLIVDEIHEVMKKVAEMSIISELSYIRAQARTVFHQYFMEYPLGERLEKYLTFYISQMSYEMQYGRESAIEMISTFISSFPMKTLRSHSGTLFITLGARLVNDDIPTCRKMVADALSCMINRLDKADRLPLFDIVVLWLKDNKVSHRRLAAQLCGIFVAVEKTSFEPRLKKLVPLILKQFTSESVKKDSGDKEYERLKDHHLFQILQLLLKICSNCPIFLKMNEISNIARHVQSLLGYPHDWVRLSAAQFIGFVLSSINIDEFSIQILDKEKKSHEEGYLQNDRVGSVKSLTLDLCDQLQPGNISSDLAEQVIKNLVFIGRVLEKVPILKKDQNDKKINILWLTKRMRKVVNTEVVETPTNTVLRTAVFKWIAGMATVLNLEYFNPILNHLLAPLVREMITTEESNAPLRQLAKEVGNLIKNKVGNDVYTKALSSLQQSLSVKRSERKRARTQLAVTDPEVFAKKKIKRHERKIEAKKRRISERKGIKKNFKRRKTIDLEPVAEVM